MSVGGFLPQGPTVRGSIDHPEKVDSWAPGPNCPGPNCPPPKSGQLGPGAQLSALKKVDSWYDLQILAAYIQYKYVYYKMYIA